VTACGDTFLGGAEVHGGDHLWVVINDPQARLRPKQPADAALVVRIRAAASAALEFPGDLRPLL
jgi:hypothetical protein